MLPFCFKLVLKNHEWDSFELQISGTFLTWHIFTHLHFGFTLSESLSINHLFFQTVWPFQRGEVSVQAYNATLSLSSLQKSSDAIFVFENDWLLKLCHHKMGLDKSSLNDLNTVASQQLANVLLPVDRSHGIVPIFSKMYFIYFSFWLIVTQILLCFCDQNLLIFLSLWIIYFAVNGEQQGKIGTHQGLQADKKPRNEFLTIFFYIKKDCVNFIGLCRCNFWVNNYPITDLVNIFYLTRIW